MVSVTIVLSACSGIGCGVGTACNVGYVIDATFHNYGTVQIPCENAATDYDRGFYLMNYMSFIDPTKDYVQLIYKEIVTVINNPAACSQIACRLTIY